MSGKRDKASELLSRVHEDPILESFQELHWEGSFQDYLELALDDPRLVRNAFQRLYDMVLSHGTEEVVKNKERLVRYRQRLVLGFEPGEDMDQREVLERLEGLGYVGEE